MSAADNPVRVVSICDPGPTLTQITSALGSQNEFELVEVLDDIEHLGSDLHEAEAEIILIDHQVGGQTTLDIIDNLAMQFPNTVIVAILPIDNPMSAQQVTLSGARGFLVQPFTQVNLLSTLRRVRVLQSRQRQAQAPVIVDDQERVRPLRTLVVYSPRGGVGCTTVAVNLSIALHEETEARVLLMEGKLFFGDLDVMLNIRTHSSLADLIAHSSSMDEMLVREVVHEHISGIYTLLAPINFQVAQGIHPQDMFAIMTGLQKYFDYIVIDTSSNLDENTVTLLDAADRILLVTSPELAALHDVSRFMRISQSLAYPPEKVLLLLNQADRPGGVKLREIETATDKGIFAQIPDDPVNALRCLNRGIPLILKNPRSPVSRSYKKLAKQMTTLGQEQPTT
ncbi:CpaE family protein [Chloroflexota bacterium]